jgi:guanylate kinase
MSNPNLERKGFAVIISGPSGSGKTTLCTKLQGEFEDLSSSISVTTRQMRPGEVNGADYLFLDQETFSSLAITKKLIEYTEIHGNYYGTQKGNIESAINSGSNILFDVDYKGANSIKEFFIENAVTIFVLPPSLDEINNRLQSRGQDRQMVIAGRVNSAKKEVQNIVNYDYIIFNDNLENAYSNLKSIYVAEQQKRSRIKNLVPYIKEYISVI